MIRLAETYLRALAHHPGDVGTELMPQDQRWMKAARDLYRELPEADQMIIDSIATYNGISNHKRTKGLKRLALLLLCRAGLESEYTILIPQET